MHGIEGCICRLQHDPAYLGSVTIEPYMAVILTLHSEGIDVAGYYLQGPEFLDSAGVVLRRFNFPKVHFVGHDNSPKTVQKILNFSN